MSIKLIGNKKTNATVGFFIILMCMGLVPVYIYLCSMCVQCLQRPEGGVKFSRNEIAGGGEPLCRCQDSKLGPPKE